MAQIRVVATRLGWYGMQRHYPADSDHARAGEPFLVEESAFSKRWMKRVDEKAEDEKPAPAPAETSKPARAPKGTGSKDVI